MNTFFIIINLICWLDSSNPYGPLNLALAGLLVGFAVGDRIYRSLNAAAR